MNEKRDRGMVLNNFAILGNKRTERDAKNFDKLGEDG